MNGSTSTPHYGPDEDAMTIFLERGFLASDLLTGLGYGVQLVLYGACARHLWTQRHTKRHSLFLLAYTSVVLIVETIFVAVQARDIQLATLFVITFLSDALVLWRCWVIWQSPWQGRWVVYFAVSIPFLMPITSFAMGTLWALESSQPDWTIYSALPWAFGISYFTISLSTNVILTLLIIGRLLQYRASIMSSLLASYAKHYLSLATILIESAALYSILAVCFLVLYAVNNGID
ncbi:unnamed protein product [Peniophora sp. CBMAI 1063]|nr:unnamed protein product [Peniophora sp. CBMAI 1063]